MSHGSTPPATMQRLLNLLLRGLRAEYLIGDLEEEFHRRAGTVGKAPAARWYRHHAWRAIVAWWAPRGLLARWQLARRRTGILHATLVSPAIAAAALVAVLGITLLPSTNRSHSTATVDRIGLVLVHAVDRTGERRQLFTFPELDSLDSALSSLGRVAGYSVAARTAHRTGVTPHHIRVARVSRDFFETLRVPAYVGRVPTSDELQEVAPIAVVSSRYWTSTMGGDSSVVGTTLSISGPSAVDATIIGIMPEWFAVPSTADVWIPASHWLRQDNDREVSVLARLAEGSSEREASAEVATLVAGMPLARNSPAGIQSAWIEPAPFGYRGL